MNDKMTLIEELEFWSSKYEFNFQFWGEGLNQVFVNKGCVQLFESAQNKSVKESIIKAIKYCRKINQQTT